MKRQLTDIEKGAILKDHIPYKLTQLRHHHHYKEIFKTQYLSNNSNLYRKHEICAIEIGFIAGRLFLEFLGIGYDKKSNKIVERIKIKNDDLCIEDFDCNPVPLDHLSEIERMLLAVFYNRANKGAGHFTWEKREVDGFETIDEGTVIIESFLKKYLYDKLGLELCEK